MKRSVPLVTAVVAASALALAGCAGTAAPEGTSADGKLQVVTSTNVYGDIVSAIAGDTVDVTAIISSTRAICFATSRSSLMPLARRS